MMENQIKRPRLILVLQGFLLLFALIQALNLVVTILATINQTQPEAPLLHLLGFVYNLALVTINLVAVEGIAGRKNYGRWLAIAAFAIPAAIGLYPIYILLAVSRFDGKFALNILAVLFLACLAVLQVAAALYLALSPRVKIYFGLRSEPLATDPPPPPSFES